MVATNQNPFRQWALVKPDENGFHRTFPRWTFTLRERAWVDEISTNSAFRSGASKED